MENPMEMAYSYRALLSKLKSYIPEEDGAIEAVEASLKNDLLLTDPLAQVKTGALVNFSVLRSPMKTCHVTEISSIGDYQEIFRDDPPISISMAGLYLSELFCDW